ncbi:metalloprotease [Phlyctema vagabunda]|uniref:Metalloprotease n=1 Tax=Phlyctema vagabunda TaxID=108571 RepID=A0ABR4PMW6_9HELO
MWKQTSLQAMCLLVLQAAGAIAQRTCGNSQPPPEIVEVAESFAANSASRLMATTIEVNTYIHLVTTSAEANLYTDKMLNDQITAMNAAFNPYDISFKLISIDKTVNTAWANDQNELAMKRALRKGTYADLNLYFQTYLQEDNLGYCYYPVRSPGSATSTTTVTDGCSVVASTIPDGGFTNYELGGTAVHEVGHWFGLAHVFENYSCTGAGDGVADTPIQANSTRGCPASADSCPGVAGLDSIHNYMDYSYDECYEEFTPGQKTRMFNMWDTYRLSYQ